ncbi:hypothetical protein BELL_0143g00130 [Botrytis elliptica]|uniref:Carrier domain-containing protein n=1 Tax=Botrytis elliptica TaxID=278938 RepID=A0A4Z1JZG3_9HELO|nr:hypothetical protein EAE99_007416 [Botrytis elliptica]TGO76672.1 hypothetical protein BELL_0143g00130 [Botrytis elliptica]
MNLQHSTLVFGPQTNSFDAAHLSAVRNSLVSNKRLKPFYKAIAGLSDFLPTLLAHDSFLQKLPAVEYCTFLIRWLENGSSAGEPMNQDLPNMVCTPLTVIIHVVQFFNYLETHYGPIHAYDNFLASATPAQGFCIGFLTAAAVTCASDEDTLAKLCSNALRLALCIGAYVDLDQSNAGENLTTAVMVSWSEKNKPVCDVYEFLKDFPEAYISVISDKTKITITLPQKLRDSISKALLDQGYSVIPLVVFGRFHSSVQTNACQKLIQLCASTESLQFPQAESPRTALRTGEDGQEIREGPLHEIALVSLLSRQSKWYATIANTVAQLDASQKRHVLQVGFVDCIPSRLVREFNLKVVKLSKFLPNDGSHTIATPLQEDILQSRPSKEHVYPKHSIAVVGYSCKFPGANSPEEFWDILTEGKSLLRTIPNGRFPTEGLRRSSKQPFYGNFVDDIDAFDHRFFQKSPREAASMDPQQRFLLECSYNALSSSGYFGRQSMSKSKGGNERNDVGCFFGVCGSDYNDNIASHPSNAFSSLGSLRAFLSGKVSHFFGFTGPSVIYDTACSSSAVAIDAACKSLQAGDCSSALAGGVSLYTSPYFYENLGAASFLSPTGATKPFDAGADGYCRGEGVGIVVLKRLENAIADDDPILGVIVGSAVNQSMNSTSITVPNLESQSMLFEKVAALAGSSPSEFTYVEAHGTGTPIGDPIEINAIRKVFGGAHRSIPLHVASVKGNIGHLEGASGVASLIKVLLMMKHKSIPKQANHLSLNPKIRALEPDKMKIPLQTTPWEADLRIASINNYGASGSNASIAVVEPPSQVLESRHINGPESSPMTAKYPIRVSANSPGSLAAFCDRLKTQVSQLCQNSIALRDLSYGLAETQNWNFSNVFTAAVSDLSELDNALINSAEGYFTIPQKVKPVILCFGGQTSATASVDRNLYNQSTLFSRHINDCDEVLRSLGKKSIFPSIFDSSRSSSTVNLHSKLFVLQYSAAKTWLDSGIQVSSMIGHSFGQLTALTVAGSLSLEDGLKLVVGRAELVERLWGHDKGSMLAVETDQDTLNKLIDLTRKQGPAFEVEVACYNGPTSFVLVGTHLAIAKVEETFNNNAVEFSSLKARKLDVTHGYHSSLTDVILPEYMEIVKGLKFGEPKIHVETCSEFEAWLIPSPELVVEHTRTGVYFGNAVERINQKFGPCTWLDVGSGSAITKMARRALKSGTSTVQLHQFLDIKLDNERAIDQLANTTLELWKAGSKAHFWLHHPCEKDSYKRIDLPPYQFEKARHWLEWKEPQTAAPLPSTPRDSSTKRPSSMLSFVKFHDKDRSHAEFRINVHEQGYQKYITGHAVLGQPLCPAPLYMELASTAITILENYKLLQDTPIVPRIQDLEIKAPLGKALDKSVALNLRADGESWLFEFSSQSPTKKRNSSQPVIHATGKIVLRDFFPLSTSRTERLIPQTRLTTIQSDSKARSLQGTQIYDRFSRVVTYSEMYKGVRDVYAREHEIVGKIVLPKESQLSGLGRKTVIDPIALDNFIQIAGLHVNCLIPINDNEVNVCVKISDLEFHKELDTSDSQSGWMVFSTYSTTGPREVENDIYVFDSQSHRLVLTIFGAIFMRVNINSLTKTLSKANARTTIAINEPQMTFNNFEVEKLTVSTTMEDEGYTTIIHSEEEDNEEISPLLAGPNPISRLEKLLIEHLDLPDGSVRPEMNLVDEGLDSLLAIELGNDIGKIFGVRNLALDEFQTFGELCIAVFGKNTKPFKTHIKNKNIDANALTFSLKKIEEPIFIEKSASETLVPDDPSFLKGSQLVFEKVRREFDTFAKETGFNGFWENVYPSQKKLVLSYVVEAFVKLGCLIPSLIAGEVLPSIEFLPKHQKLVSQLYNILEDGNLIKSGEGRFLRTNVPIDTTSSSKLYQEILAEAPLFHLEHRVLHITGSNLADCLTGKADPVQILFGKRENKTLLEEWYATAPAPAAITAHLTHFLHQALSAHSGIVKILEIGGGTGGTTKHMIDFLTSNNIPFEYTFSDISPMFVNAVKKRFAKYPNVTVITLDIEKPVSENMQKKFHIVLSTNCIHATKNISNSTANIRDMLLPNGFCSLVEFTRNIFWFDLVFGLLDGWWFFEDGRSHVLADEWFWESSMKTAGFGHVSWTHNSSAESRTVRIITGFLEAPESTSVVPKRPRESFKYEKLEYKMVGECRLFADVYYDSSTANSEIERPVALMIHGGGHTLYSRKDINPKHIRLLQNKGFIPVSIDYRFIPEVSLREGAMSDVCDALAWARNTLPSIVLKNCPQQRVDGSRVVVLGWSTGGTLAMSSAFASLEQGTQPPEAILAFYCPTNYDDEWWKTPIFPKMSISDPSTPYNLLEGVQNTPVTSYTPTTSTGASTQLFSLQDPRTRFILHMNWRAQALPILINGLPSLSTSHTISSSSPSTSYDNLPMPSPRQIARISPYSYIVSSHYKTPTFLIHGTEDDLIPWQQSQKTYEALKERGVEAGIEVLERSGHLFDLTRDGGGDEGVRAVERGMEFLKRFV